MTQMSPNEIVVDPSDGETYWLGDAQMTIVTRGGTGGVTLIHWTSPPGGTAPLHVHHDLDDCFFVIDGHVTLWCDGRTRQAGPGSFVRMPQGIPHSVHVDGDVPLHALLVQTNEHFVDFVKAAGAPVDGHPTPPPIDPQAIARAAQQYGQDILGPSPFAVDRTPRRPTT